MYLAILQFLVSLKSEPLHQLSEATLNHVNYIC